jgi:hypothetical protein
VVEHDYWSTVIAYETILHGTLKSFRRTNMLGHNREQKSRPQNCIDTKHAETFFIDKTGVVEEHEAVQRNKLSTTGLVPSVDVTDGECEM